MVRKKHSYEMKYKTRKKYNYKRINLNRSLFEKIFNEEKSWIITHLFNFTIVIFTAL